MKNALTIIVLIWLLTSCRTNPPTLVLKANDYFFVGQYDKAIEYYNKALKKKIKCYDKGFVYYKLGESYRLSKDTIIIVYYEHAIELLKRDWGGPRGQFTILDKYNRYITLALSYYNLNNYKQASNWFERAYKKNTIVDSIGLSDQSFLEKYVFSLKKLGQKEKADSVTNDYINRQNNK